MTSRSTLDIVIVNWNSGNQLQDCLSALVTHGHGESFSLERVVVVDNASSDGSATDLSKFNLPLSLIANTSNAGFGVACNQAVRGSRASFILLLNPDTKIGSGALDRTVALLASRPDVGIVGTQLVDAAGRVTPTCARFLTPGMVLRRILGLEQLVSWWPPHFMADWDHRSTAIVDHVMGAFYMVRRSLYENLQGMDERFFVYLEDLDFSLRAKHRGFATLYLADAQVYHRGGGATYQAKGRSLYYALSSRILYGFKHYHPSVAWALLTATLAIEPVTRGIHALLTRSVARLSETREAYWLLLTNLGDVLRRRR